jgi:hypothetical protein
VHCEQPTLCLLTGRLSCCCCCCPQLALPVVPPMVLYGNRVEEGHLGIKFMRVKARPWDTASKCVQVRRIERAGCCCGCGAAGTLGMAAVGVCENSPSRDIRPRLSLQTGAHVSVALPAPNLPPGPVAVVQLPAQPTLSRPSLQSFPTAATPPAGLSHLP